MTTSLSENKESVKNSLEHTKINQEKLKEKYGSDNPCTQEQELSIKCLEIYDKTHCYIYFENYKNCKRFWSMIEKQRAVKGIKPLLPVLEEREKIKAEYFKTR